MLEDNRLLLDTASICNPLLNTLMKSGDEFYLVQGPMLIWTLVDYDAETLMVVRADQPDSNPVTFNRG